MPLDDSPLELLDADVVVVLLLAMPPTPAPAAPDDKEFAVPPSPGVEDPGAEHAAKPQASNPNGKIVSESVLFMKARLSKSCDVREAERGAKMSILWSGAFVATQKND